MATINHGKPGTWYDNDIDMSAQNGDNEINKSIARQRDGKDVNMVKPDRNLF